jgi:putative salt-induced outer membrane protein YdiY
MNIRKTSLFFLCLALGSAAVRAEDAAASQKPWKNVTEASLVSANGNSKASTTSGKNTFTYNWTKTMLELIGGGLGSKSKGETTAEKYFASEKLSYKLTDRVYTFEKYGWDKDRFAGIRNRHDIQGGLGRELIKAPKDLLIGELGGGYVSEERINTKTNTFGSGRAYTKYTHTISDTSSFSQDAEYLANFDDKDDFRVNTETALLSNLSTHLSLKVSYTWKHVGKPPVGFSRNDTTTSISLVATY